LQTVLADDPSDTADIAEIRAHLRAEAARFAAGDFADPARIHGAEMPGLTELKAHSEKIERERRLAQAASQRSQAPS
jgi:hypothetical protein